MRRSWQTFFNVQTINVGYYLVPDTVLAFCIGAVLMIAGGITELILGVKAERRSLEDIARPLHHGRCSSDRPQGQLRTAT